MMTINLFFFAIVAENYNVEILWKILPFNVFRRFR